MFKLMLLAVVVSALLLLRRRYTEVPAHQRRQWLLGVAFWIAIGVFLALGLTGRSHWLTSVAAAALGGARLLLPLLWHKVRQRFAPQQEENPFQPTTANNLSEREAWQVLGLSKGASREDIISAHRRLMQKVHPDHGGNDYLAARINEAKDVLLKIHR